MKYMQHVQNVVGHIKERIDTYFLTIATPTTTIVQYLILYLVHKSIPEFSLHFSSLRSRFIHRQIRYISQNFQYEV